MFGWVFALKGLALGFGVYFVLYCCGPWARAM